ncbi:MAG: IIA-like nitrogen-regulatory protein PtsN [Burkholderiales bacterium]|nr:IIA-like nitrogen-regulatory protein PtsN [Burkholderiales bacterium]
MSLVAKLLSVSHVALDLPASSKKRLFEQAGLMFENLDGIARSLVFDSLFARETACSRASASARPVSARASPSHTGASRA